MKVLSNVITSISVVVNIMTAVFLLDMHLMEKYILAWWKYTPTRAWWESLCEGIYNHVIIGIFGDVLIAAIFFLVVSSVVLVFNIIPMICNCVNKRKKEMVVVSCSTIVLIVEIVFLFNLVVGMFMSI